MPAAATHDDHPHDEDEKLRWEAMMAAGQQDALGLKSTGGPHAYKKYDPKNFNVTYDEKDGYRATEMKIFSFKRPHMRSFHFSWFSFFLAFLAWFAFAPLMPVIGKQINLSKKDGWTVNIMSVLSTVIARFIVGPMCDEFGPRTLQCMMMAFGGCMVFVAAIAVHDVTSLAIMRFLIGIVGATFVPCQYWNTLLFTKEVAGTAQAIAGGWGNLGGGATQIVMPLLYNTFLKVSDPETAWRYAFCVPALSMLVISITMFKFSDDSPQGNYSKLVKVGIMKKKRSAQSARDGFCDPVTWMMALHYGCCFGVELTVNNMMASYFFNRFDLTLVTAGAIASCFGLMNLFARALGGILSDKLNAMMGFSGRLWAHFICMITEAIFLILFSRMDTVGTALPVLILFSAGVQMSEGSTFGIVPYVKPSATGAVSGAVGAGGNIGAVCWGLIFRSSDAPPQDTLMLIGFIVLAVALLTPFIFIEGQPGMFFNPRFSPVTEVDANALSPSEIIALRDLLSEKEKKKQKEDAISVMA